MMILVEVMHSNIMNILSLDKMMINFEDIHSCIMNLLSLDKIMIQFEDIQLLSKIFIDSDLCHNYLHTLYLFACLF